MSAIEFAEFCGPSAVAALAGIPPLDAAVLIVAAQRARDREPDYRGAGWVDLVAALEAFELEVEAWDPVTGCRVPPYRDPLARYPERVQRRLRARAVREARQLEARGVQLPEPWTVARWIREYPRDRWLMSVGIDHALALVDGELVGNHGGEYSDARLTCVARILKRNTGD